MEWLCKRLLMFTARVADLYNLNRLEFWCYDTITANGWEGFDTFIRMDDEPAANLSASDSSEV
jgi:hypothetical protein